MKTANLRAPHISREQEAQLIVGGWVRAGFESHTLHLFLLLFPFLSLLAQIQGSQQVPEAWVLARGDRTCCRLSWHLRKPESTPPYLLPPFHLLYPTEPSLALGWRASEYLSQDQGWDRPIGPHLPAETNSTVPFTNLVT